MSVCLPEAPRHLLGWVCVGCHCSAGRAQSRRDARVCRRDDPRSQQGSVLEGGTAPSKVPTCRLLHDGVNSPQTCITHSRPDLLRTALLSSAFYCPALPMERRAFRSRSPSRAPSEQEPTGAWSALAPEHPGSWCGHPGAAWGWGQTSRL